MERLDHIKLWGSVSHSSFDVVYFGKELSKSEVKVVLLEAEGKLYNVL